MIPAREDSTTDYIRQKAIIYRSNEPTKYQHAINDASITLCLANPDLLSDRQKLLQECREYIHQQGYSYKKGKSRSRMFNSEPVEKPKRMKVSTAIRKSRIDELTERIKDLTDQISFKEKRREQASNVHDYKQCDLLTEQMVKLKREKSSLENEVSQLKLRQKRSDQYQAKRRPSTDRSRSSTPISSFMNKIITKSASSDFCSQSTSAEGDTANDTEVISSSDESEKNEGSPFLKGPPQP